MISIEEKTVVFTWSIFPKSRTLAWVVCLERLAVQRSTSEPDGSSCLTFNVAEFTLNVEQGHRQVTLPDFRIGTPISCLLIIYGFL